MPRFQYFRTAVLLAALFAAAATAAPAQEVTEGRNTTTDPVPDNSQDSAVPDKPAPKPATGKPKKPFGGGTPIDVIVNNKLWVDPPEPKDFVRENRRPVEELKFQPTVGLDPERPKTRTKDELKDLQSELEKAGLHKTKPDGTKTDPGAKKKVSKTPATHKENAADTSDKSAKPN
jgi:hypothetical protein